MAAAIEPSSATAIGRWENVRRQLGERLSRNLLEEVSREDLIATRRLRVRVSGRLALAYLLAATVAGSAAMRGVLEKTYLDEVVDAAVRVHALTTPHDAIEQAVRGAAAAVSAAELDAHRAASRSESWRTDASHPPTAMRVDQLLRREDRPPTVALLPADEQALAEEVSRLLQMSQTTLVGRKLEAIYG